MNKRAMLISGLIGAIIMSLIILLIQINVDKDDSQEWADLAYQLSEASLIFGYKCTTSLEECVKSWEDLVYNAKSGKDYLDRKRKKK